MTTAADRAFAYFEQGEVREEILTQFRIGLRKLINPETGAPFTEDEVKRATQQGSRFWIEANAIDLVGMAQQSRAIWLADQLRPERASSSWLHGYHGRLWRQDPLPASPGSGTVTALAEPGTNFIASTTVPDEAATTARDEAGNRYQVFAGTTTPGSGVATLTLIGIDQGTQTNLAAGTRLRWENAPLGAQPECTVAIDFSGGFPAESDAEFQERLAARIAHKPGAGNDSHVRAWAREATTAVRDAYVYACAMHAGSTLVCITQKRGTTVGPLATKANAATLASATAYLVPPGSPVVPARAFFKVVTYTEQPAVVVLLLTQPKGNQAGWSDSNPWPGFTSSAAFVFAITDATHFQLLCDTPLPGGATSLSGLNAPKLMWWHAQTSRFEQLSVASVTAVAPTLFDVVLAAPKAVQFGDFVCPDMARRETLAIAVEQYFDALGPGEVVDLATDTRADRAARFPEPAEEAPYRGGQAIITAITEALGSSLSTASLQTMSPSTPSLPADVMAGPRKLTLDRLAVLELP